MSSGEEREPEGNGASPTSSKHAIAGVWRNPTPEECETYSLRPQKDDLEPTPAEQALLDAYAYMKHLEKVSQRLKTQAAMDKMAAADAEFKQKRKKKKRNKKKRAKAAEEGGGGDEGDEASDDDSDDSQDEYDDDDATSLYQRREARLAAMRRENAEKEAAAADDGTDAAEEALRAQHLEGANADDVAGLLKRKRESNAYDEDNDTDGAKASLIANLTSLSTPPHEFSKTLELTKGKLLFPLANTSDPEFSTTWSPPEGVFAPNDGAFWTDLDELDVSDNSAGNKSNNTLAIRFSVSPEAKRFSLNLAVDKDNVDDDVLFHFNPRQFERGGQLVVNDKQAGTWGHAIALPLSLIPALFGQAACTLLIQMHGEGFDIFLSSGDNKSAPQHCARFEHRQALPTTGKLHLQFPSTDDYGSPENWTVYKVWWGHRPIMAQGDLSGIPGVNQFDSVHPRKLFLSNLPKLHSESETAHRKAELEQAFARYGGDRGVVHVICPTRATYAFVEMETAALASRALAELSGKTTYTLSRARRTRHEALQDARRETGGTGGTTSEW